MIDINLPVDENTIRSLKAGDQVLISGTLITARDEAHKFLVRALEGNLVGEHDNTRFERIANYVRNGAIYHCGPVVVDDATGTHIVSAGPTTSIREELYSETIIPGLQARIVMGKGGMGAATQRALQSFGAVYVHLTGGAAALLAAKMERIEDVFFREEFGDTEAMWVVHVNQIPGVVTMDASGESHHERIRQASEQALNAILSGSD